MAAVSEALPLNPSSSSSSSLNFASLPSLKWADQTRFSRANCNPTPDSKSLPSSSHHDASHSPPPIADVFHSPKHRKTLPSSTRLTCDKPALRVPAKTTWENTGEDVSCDLEEEEQEEEEEELRVTGSSVLLPETRPKSLRLRGLAPPLEGEEKKKLDIPKLSISLSREEIEEDVWALTGSRPSRRPKKRLRNVQNKLDQTFPGLCLPTVSADRYRIADQSESRKEVDIVRRFLKFC
ncbi:uncharacterized protein [Aristolochia californica]|uniref:uncharacterized protein n=1 Tax=Aristolochia californica TaxID=171875 RepID=UPI0035E22F3A